MRTDIQTCRSTYLRRWCIQSVFCQNINPSTRPHSWNTECKEGINKQKSFDSRDAAAIREAKAVLSAEIGLAKSSFRDKVGKLYQTMNTGDAFRNLKVMANDVSASQSARSNTRPDATDLNKLYTRFDSKDFTSKCT